MQVRSKLFRLFQFTISAAILGSASVANAAYENLWTAGHGDIGIHYDQANNNLELGYHLHDNAVINGVALGADGEFEADYLTVVIPNAAFSRFDAGVAGLPGTFGSNTFWYISEPNPGAVNVPWVGIGAEEVANGIFVNDTLGLRLKSIVESPVNSQFVIYRSTLFGFDVFVDTQNLGASNLVNLIAGSHGHYYFGFSQPGTYMLEFEAIGNIVGGGTSIGSAVYAFNVVPEPAAWVSMSMALVSIGVARHFRRKSAND